MKKRYLTTAFVTLLAGACCLSFAGCDQLKEIVRYDQVVEEIDNLENGGNLLFPDKDKDKDKNDGEAQKPSTDDGNGSSNDNNVNGGSYIPNTQVAGTYYGVKTAKTPDGLEGYYITLGKLGTLSDNKGTAARYAVKSNGFLEITVSADNGQTTVDAPIKVDGNIIWLYNDLSDARLDKPVACLYKGSSTPSAADRVKIEKKLGTIGGNGGNGGETQNPDVTPEIKLPDGTVAAGRYLFYSQRALGQDGTYKEYKAGDSINIDGSQVTLKENFIELNLGTDYTAKITQTDPVYGSEMTLNCTWYVLDSAAYIVNGTHILYEIKPTFNGRITLTQPFDEAAGSITLKCVNKGIIFEMPGSIRATEIEMPVEPSGVRATDMSSFRNEFINRRESMGGYGQSSPTNVIYNTYFACKQTLAYTTGRFTSYEVSEVESGTKMAYSGNTVNVMGSALSQIVRNHYSSDGYSTGMDFNDHESSFVYTENGDLLRLMLVNPSYFDPDSYVVDYVGSDGVSGANELGYNLNIGNPSECLTYEFFSNFVDDLYEFTSNNRRINNDGSFMQNLKYYNNNVIGGMLFNYENQIAKVESLDTYSDGRGKMYLHAVIYIIHTDPNFRGGIISDEYEIAISADFTTTVNENMLPSPDNGNFNDYLNNNYDRLFNGQPLTANLSEWEIYEKLRVGKTANIQLAGNVNEYDNVKARMYVSCFDNYGNVIADYSNYYPVDARTLGVAIVPDTQTTSLLQTYPNCHIRLEFTVNGVNKLTMNIC